MAGAIARLAEYGQRPWYDNLTRPLVRDGGLDELVRDDGIVGVTSNPTIFEKAMATGDAYDAQLRDVLDQPIEDAYWALVTADVGDAADRLRPLFDRGDDGFVSIEVSPDLAYDADETLRQVRALQDRLARPNVLVKIPATREGIPAIEEAIAEGRSINVTLIFSLVRYAEVIEAYQRGLERLVDAGGDPGTVASVASFFVSRVDTETDRRLPDAHELRGRSAVANAKLAYRQFVAHFANERWERLAALGARVQRPLWASTSTKNPAYSDTLYVDELVGPQTVNTLAQPSIDALRDHGDPQPGAIFRDVDEADQAIAGLGDAGVDFADVTATLEREGVDAFARSYHDALETLEKRRRELTP